MTKKQCNLRGSHRTIVKQHQTAITSISPPPTTHCHHHHHISLVTSGQTDTNRIHLRTAQNCPELLKSNRRTPQNAAERRKTPHNISNTQRTHQRVAPVRHLVFVTSPWPLCHSSHSVAVSRKPTHTIHITSRDPYLAFLSLILTVETPRCRLN